MLSLSETLKAILGLKGAVFATPPPFKPTILSLAAPCKQKV